MQTEHFFLISEFSDFRQFPEISTLRTIHQQDHPVLVSPVTIPITLFVGTATLIGSVWFGHAVMGRYAEAGGAI